MRQWEAANGPIRTETRNTHSWTILSWKCVSPLKSTYRFPSNVHALFQSSFINIDAYIDPTKHSPDNVRPIQPIRPRTIYHDLRLAHRRLDHVVFHHIDLQDGHASIVRDPDRFPELLALGRRAHAKREAEGVPLRVFREVADDEASREACSSPTTMLERMLMPSPTPAERNDEHKGREVERSQRRKGKDEGTGRGCKALRCSRIEVGVC